MTKKKIKVLNLYAGIGGNRKLWGEEHKITAVELNPKIAKIYKKNFPNDEVIIADAHQYLLEHYKEYDFIWSSPPCPTHSVTNHFLNAQGVIRYPDMKLWQEIIFLREWFKGKWVVENVKSYYHPFLEAQEVGRHYFWANFNISNIKIPIDIGRFNGTTEQRKKIREKSQIERNCVNPIIGKHIFKCAFKEHQKGVFDFG